MTTRLSKLSDLARRWVENKVWVQTGVWQPDPVPPPPDEPDYPDDPIEEDPYHPCPDGYHLVSEAVLTGPYPSPPTYRIVYSSYCAKDI